MTFYFIQIELTKFRLACGIPDDTTDSIVITGGRTRGHYNNPWNLVSRYDRNGFVEDLPRMNRNRMGHGCGHYVNSDNQKVCI